MKIWLIGVGYMGIEYAKVLHDIDCEFICIGNGESSAKKFEEATGLSVIRGGLSNFLKTKPAVPDYAIVCVSVESLAKVAVGLINYNVKNILLEKPAGRNPQEIISVYESAENKKAKVFLAYNRRFYASTIAAKKIITEDGGIQSFNFEFTEWSNTISNIDKADSVKNYWFLANSTHVCDLAFYVGGVPSEITCYHSGNLLWHKSAAIFAGAGITENNVLFSYQANWSAPGRWSVEFLTNKHRLIFRPMEKLQIQNLDSVLVNFCDIDYFLDEKYKPGLFLQVKNFLENNTNGLCSITDQIRLLSIYKKIANY
ncbi:Gfo/Idh/MocA family oxidoreductase [Treponema pedis]|uniref:Gfo/Idh/MocA family oxidoreductase n=1 Tax=Treponema pedis TaxID=409322 RepID=A0A7S7AWV7_9SPIR|nr:Gfo/Idh/MocA family oxidoreductase [Treponema pedis]QOW61715.1 Gfo/Idh/MocA family oxidoreductase [Treponema pedis]